MVCMTCGQPTTSHMHCGKYDVRTADYHDGYDRGLSEERRRIVEWLRGVDAKDPNEWAPPRVFADAIERGDHLERTDGK